MANLHVQSRRVVDSMSGAGDGTSSSSYTGSVVSGNLLVAAIAWAVPARTISSITDSRGSIWAPATTAAIRSTDRVIQLWYALAGGAGANTVVVTFDQAATMTVVHDIAEYSGPTAQDGSGVAGNDAIQNPSIDLSVGTEGDLVVGAILANIEQPDSGAAFAKRQFGSAAFYDVLEDDLDASAGTLAVNFTTTQLVGYAIVAAAFSGVTGPAVTQYYLGSDVTAGNWTTSTGSGTLTSMVDETTRDDTDYIQSAVNPSADLVELEWANVQIPSVNTDHTVSYVLKGDASCQALVALLAGDATTVTAWVHTALPPTFQRFDQELSTAAADAWSVGGYAGSHLTVTAG